MVCRSTMHQRDLKLCSMIKFLTKEGKKPKEILLPSKVLVRAIKQGRESIEDDSRSGRRVEASSKKYAMKWRIGFYKIVVLRSVLQHMNWAFQLALFPLSSIQSDDVKGQFPMGVTKQELCHQQYSVENLYVLRANPENFFSRIIKDDETWVHHHNPETKQKSMQWKHKGSPIPKKFCVQ